jgi:hypothetical protein
MRSHGRFRIAHGAEMIACISPLAGIQKTFLVDKEQQSAQKFPRLAGPELI